MKHKSPVSNMSRLHSSERGIALVVTLAALVLVTMAAVAFFSRATANRLIESSRANQVQSEQLARSGVDFVSAQFLSDITNNSTAVSVGSSTIYRPKASTNMVPERVLNVGLEADVQFTNLVRQSVGGDSSATPAPNGRAISITAWNAPMLLGGDGFIDGTKVPTWIYLNRDGTTAATPSASTVGRFAFNAYNLGGLLDINAFGHGDRFSAADKKTKGSPVSAVLDALPGISSTPTKDNDSSSWPPTWRITGDWAKVTYSGSGGPDDILKYYSVKGWRVPFSQGGIPAHRFFASRQDLIRYAKNNPETFNNTAGRIPALQYLTHWSRDVDLPTHEPASGRPRVAQSLAEGGNDAYEMDDALNPSLLTATKMGGAPAISKRFPLSRLSMVSTPVPPAAPTANAADIYKYFGLTWDSSNNRWVYDHGDPADILPLSDIPAERDPDFFELLKAAISVGSLGKQFGIPFPLAYLNIGFPAQKGGTDGSVNYQLIQIAANIIDQYDTDGYPTRILFDGREFYGVEDLPRLHAALDRSFRVGDTKITNFIMPNGADIFLQVWMVQLQLWNPHDFDAGEEVIQQPLNYRIVARSLNSVGLEANRYWNPPSLNQTSTYYSDLRFIGGPDCSPVINYYDDEHIAFTLGNNSLFREPTYLARIGYPSGSNANGVPNTTDMRPDDLRAPGNPDTVVSVYFTSNIGGPVLDVNQSLTYSFPPRTEDALGFVVGYMPGQLGNMSWGGFHRALGGPLSFDLQYQSGEDWWTIDTQQLALTPQSRNFGQNIFMANRVDPRTDRWGSFYLGAQANASEPIPNAYLVPFQFRNFSITSNPSPNLYRNLTLYSANTPAVKAAMCPGWLVEGELTTSDSDLSTAAPGRLQRNDAGRDPFNYTDPDGVQRRGIAAYAEDTSSEGWPMNSSNTTYNPSYTSSSRPIVLNRPFRSIAELGNVFRGTPWRNLDMMTPESGDRVLLDIFTLEEAPSDNLVAGRVNLNMVSQDVLTALIQGAGMVDGTSTINKATASDMAIEFGKYINGTGGSKNPLKDRSEIVGRWVTGTTYAGAAQEMAAKLPAAQKPLPRNRDTIVASLADVGTVRTWNFLIDVVAQSGTVANGQFVPQGESRVWECIAIDRFTARVVARSSENIRN